MEDEPSTPPKEVEEHDLQDMGVRPGLARARYSLYAPSVRSFGAQFGMEDEPSTLPKEVEEHDLQDMGVRPRLARARYSLYAPSVRSFGAWEDAEPQRIKLVVVGDRAAAGTALLHTFSKGVYPKAFVPSIFENYVATMVWAYQHDIQRVDDELYEVALWDNTITNDYDRLRAGAYRHTHVLLLCFSVASPDSFESVRDRWISEIFHFCHGVPFILLGTKCELRDDPATRERLSKECAAPVTREEGVALAKAAGAAKYMECDALTMNGVNSVFDEAVRAAVASPRPKRPRPKRPQSSIFPRLKISRAT